MEYIFTFGFGQHHGQDQTSLSSHYTVIEAESWMMAREIMYQKRGNKWSFQYHSKEEAGVEKYNLKFIPFEDVQPQVGPNQ